MQIIVMSFFELGSIKSFDWTRSNSTNAAGRSDSTNAGRFNLACCIKQAVVSLVYAYSVKGIVHGDFHAANVLLRRIRRRSIMYKFKTFTIEAETMGMQAVIADFENSKVVDDFEGGERFAKFNFYQDLQKFFALLPHFVRGVDAKIANNAVLVVSRAFQDELPPVDLVDPSAGVGLLDAICAFGTCN